MDTLHNFFNSFLGSFIFWAAWIIIPVVMEVIPSVGSVFPKEYPIPAFEPEISLLIPVYNSADTLEECIRSIDESDYPNSQIRIFLVNNQS